MQEVRWLARPWSPRPTVIGLIVLSLATLVLALQQLSPATANPGAEGDCQQGFVLDFAKFPDGTAVPRGTKLGEQYSPLGIHISAIANEGRPNQLIVFDSNASDTRDPDLEAGLGNLAIIPEHLIDEDGNGLVDDPNDSIRGGKQTYSFDSERTVGSFIIVDIDHGVPASHYAAAFDKDGNLIKKVPIPILSDGDFQTITVNANGVRRLEIVYRDSAGVTGIELDCPPGTPTPTPTPPGGTPTPTPPAGTPTPSPTPPGGTPTPTPPGGTPTPTPVGETPTPTPAPTPTPTPTPTPPGGTPTPTPTPSPTPPGQTPSPTPPGGTPTPTPPGETPSPTPPGGTPSPTPVGSTPTPTPEGGTPTPTPAGGTPTSAPTPTPTPIPSFGGTPTPTPTTAAVAGVVTGPGAQGANQAPAGGGRPDSSSFPVELMLLAAGWAAILLGVVMLRRPQR